jgi:hypothetical protein
MLLQNSINIVCGSTRWWPHVSFVDTNEFFFVVIEHDNDIGLLGRIALPKPAPSIQADVLATGDMDCFACSSAEKVTIFVVLLFFCD